MDAIQRLFDLVNEAGLTMTCNGRPVSSAAELRGIGVLSFMSRALREGGDPKLTPAAKAVIKEKPQD